MKKFVLLAFILSLIVVIALCCSPETTPSCTTKEYDPPYKVVFIDGVADVYGGVDTPSESIKGTLTGGAGGIEAKCGSYYRLQGVDWWGWVKISDTHK